MADRCELRKALHAYVAATMKNLECIPVEIGGVEDHIHILCLFPRTQSVADVVKETKRVSTNWLQEKAAGLTDFHWQSGYGVFSVSQSNVDGVVEYIRHQEEHHRELTFQDEYRAFLRKHAVEFDERYVWD
jgi:REP element-mobilizing transposase RayT